MESSQIEAKKGIKRLKNGFLLLLIGEFVAFVPGLSLIASVAIAIGLLLILLSWSPLSKSNLAHSEHYKNTNSWIKKLVIIFFASIIVIVVAESFPFSLSMFFATTIELLIYLLAWLKISGSLQMLGKDTNSPKLERSGRCFVYLAYVYFALNEIWNIFPAEVSSAAPLSVGYLFSNQYAPILAGGLHTVFIVSSLAFSGFAGYLSYLAYSDLRKFLPDDTMINLRKL